MLRALRWAGGAFLLVASLPLGGLACALGLRDAALGLWCRLALATLGVRARVVGNLPAPGSLVAFNHIGYLDILIAGALCPGRFVAKEEIARWPLIGLAARLAGTLFVDRASPRRSREFLETSARSLSRGDRLLLFPEGGILTGGAAVAPFRPMFFDAAVRAGRPVVPAAFRYLSPQDARVWAWTDEGGVFAHLRRRLFPAGPVVAELRFGEPIADGDRKERAQRAREAVAALAGAPRQEGRFEP